jgi:hypothetical protein
MRLKNKIRIKGDTLNIFEEVDKYNSFKVGDFVKIEPAAAQQSGLDPNKSYEIQGFVNYGKGMSKSINAVLDKELYKPYVYPPKGIISVKFITKEVSEGSFNPMKSNAVNEAKEKKDPKDKKKADKTNYGQKDIADVDMVNPYELRKGIRIEMVDIDDYEKAMDKAVKKLKKDPMFYSNLIANVKETKGKRSDVPTEVKDKKLNKVSDKLKDKANEMSVSKKDAAKKNANDSLNKKEKASGKPKGVKEMTMKPKASKGMKSMSVPGKEKKTNLKESFNLWDAFKKNILR